MKSLKDRWRKDLNACRDEIITALKIKQPLTEVEGIPLVNGRIDLRGITIPRECRIEKYALNNVDLSFATLSGSRWISCDLNDLIIEFAKLDQIDFAGCNFTSIVVENTKFNHSLINSRLDYEPGSFENVRFVKCDFSNSIHYNSLFTNCSLEDCTLDHVDFNGSRFVNCSFKGLLYETTFRGHPLINSSVFGNSKFDANQMLNVDFSNAKLEGVQFLNGVDLSKCSFPDTGKFVLIQGNRDEIFEAMRQEIETQWEGMHKKMGLNVIDMSYLNKQNRGKVVDYIEFNSLMSVDQTFAEKMFQLVKRLDQLMNGK